MHKVSDYIESGVLELYVMGMASPHESEEVEKMATLHPEVRTEIEEIEKSLEVYAKAKAVSPHATVKPMLLATIDYMKRMGGGEAPSNPSILNENSKPSDFAEWINRADMTAPENFEEIFVKLIAHTPQATTGIVWIKNMAPHEVHHDEHEKFLILEGTCDIVVGDTVHKLVPGDYFQIPLHAGHRVEVTSDVPCKVILQRVAA